MAEETQTPSEYIAHHLSFNVRPVTDGMLVNVDSVITAILLGVVSMGFIWWIVRGATSGVPNRRQAFVELIYDFVDNEVKGIFTHGDRSKFVTPTALTVLIWVLLMNAMDFLPADLMTKVTHGVFGQEHFRLVPTADVNTTFALSLSVWLLMIFFAIKAKGLGGWVHELFFSPFGAPKLTWNPLSWILMPLAMLANFAFQLIEYISKPLSHSLRLFGNMYAGEIIFLLLWMWAATGLVGGAMGFLLGWGWAIFHILIVVLQAYIFMMLTVVYISMAHEHH
ncbi:MAG TPA: F0F1 ATP synthase subunit A [Burkholderiales bacterium]|nr:F0F1 ATP synthase subunit A [Burkholderiales bacterium]